jgi:hypothetical protein
VSQISGRQPRSRIGEYSGWSETSYDGWRRSSEYVAVRDGTRLAVDVFRPTRRGAHAEAPLPVVWTPKRYVRATRRDGRLESSLSDSAAARLLSAHGYVVAAADMRGTGASFGTRREPSDPHDGLDGYDVTEWLAAQPWCNGRAGMFGVSYEGRMQLDTAAAAPPHLQAIVPEVSPFDWYGLVHQGGGYMTRFEHYVRRFGACDRMLDAAPVDGDPDGQLLTQALAEHASGNVYDAIRGELPFRDSADAMGKRPWLDQRGDSRLTGIERSGVASYHRTGWFANVRLDQFLWFANLRRLSTSDRHRLLVGPWPAAGVPAADALLWAVETLRFLDHWLKDVPNGIMDEPAVAYTVAVSTTDRRIAGWRTAPNWPPAPARTLELELDAGVLGSSPSAAGAETWGATVLVAAPTGDEANDGVVGEDFRGHETCCLAYTSEPLDEDLEVIGHPVASLYVSADGDADLLVHLCDVDPSGRSTYVSRKPQRASHRALATPPFDALELPWHPSGEADIASLRMDEPALVSFDLLPVAYRFRAGHRIRLDVAGEAGSAFTIHHGNGRRSRITLPVAELGGH